MAYVYIHKKKTNGEVFYVGVGGLSDLDKDFKRAHKTYARSSFWKGVYKKYGREVEITHKEIIPSEAFAIERYLILFYGRQNINTGSLVNLTDGGEGFYGLVFSEKHREKLSIAKKGKRLSYSHRVKSAEVLLKCRHKAIAASITPEAILKRVDKLRGRKATNETKIKMSISGKNKIFSETHRRNLGLSKKGVKKSEAHRQNHSASLMGKYVNELNPNAKKIINITTGHAFNCIKDAAKDLKVHPSTLSAMLNGKMKNKFGYIFFNQKNNQHGQSIIRR